MASPLAVCLIRQDIEIVSRSTRRKRQIPPNLPPKQGSKISGVRLIRQVALHDETVCIEGDCIFGRSPKPLGGRPRPVRQFGQRQR